MSGHRYQIGQWVNYLSRERASGILTDIFYTQLAWIAAPLGRIATIVFYRDVAARHPGPH